MLFDHYPIDLFEKIRAENAKTAMNLAAKQSRVLEDLRDRGFIKLPLGMTVIKIRNKKVTQIIKL